MVRGVPGRLRARPQVGIALPILAPIDVSPLMAAVLGSSLNSAAFSAEIFRGGIQSIEPCQWEAARAIGMTNAQAMRRIILPQPVKRMLPALTNRGVEIFKMSTLASVVAYVELLQQGKLLASLNFNPRDVHGDRAGVLRFPVITSVMRQPAGPLDIRYEDATVPSTEPSFLSRGTTR